MSLRFGGLSIGSAALLGALSLASNDALACGGCFHQQTQVDTTVVTGHRMALAISPTQTVLWDQVQYSGSPADFAWVLPVKPGAVIEASNAAWFETLDAATDTRVLSPTLACLNGGRTNVETDGDSNSGCGSSSLADAPAAEDFSAGAGGGGSAPPPVQVLHEGTVGPYDTVTLMANVPGALTGWLQMNGYAISSGEQPLIDAYTAEGFDFIALRLKPGAGIQQMQPVRVVSPGAEATLPLRMVAAGTGANVGITLFVVSEGRWQTQNFPDVTVDAANVAWDFSASDSNYAGLRSATLAQNNFKTWLTSYAENGTLFSAAPSPSASVGVQYTLTDFSTYSTIGEAYFAQGVLDGEATSCTLDTATYASSEDQVVDLCDATGKNCKAAGTGEIDSRGLACGTLDDLAVALTGMHPKDVWITRLEADLPHAALSTDLVIEASTDQTPIQNWITAAKSVNPPCTDATAALLPLGHPGGFDGAKPSRRTRNLEMLGIAIAALALAVGRRKSRPSRQSTRPASA